MTTSAKQVANSVLASILGAVVLGLAGFWVATAVANSRGVDTAKTVEAHQAAIDALKETVARQDERLKNIDRRTEAIARHLGVE